MKKPAHITPAHERTLIIRAKAGDKSAAAELIEAHTPFIAVALRKLTVPSWVPQEDLMQQGRIGLLDAIDRFDLSTGHRLLTFAYWRIKKEIITYLSEMGYPCKLPFPDVLRLKKILNKASIEAEQARDFDRPYKVYLVTEERKKGKTTWLYLVAGPDDQHPDLSPVCAGYTHDQALAMAEERRQLQLTKNLHIMELLPGGIPIHPTEYGGCDLEETYASGLESQLVTPDIAEEVLGQMALDDLMRHVTRLPALEGVLLQFMYGLTPGDTPMSNREVLGEKTRVTPEGVTGGDAGFGLEIGVTQNGLSQLARQGTGKLKGFLRRSL